MTLPISTDLPIPRTTRLAYPWKSLEVGGSFLIVDPRHYSRANSAVHYRQRTTAERFTQKATPEGLRIWRIA